MVGQVVLEVSLFDACAVAAIISVAIYTLTRGWNSSYRTNSNEIALEPVVNHNCVERSENAPTVHSVVSDHLVSQTDQAFSLLMKLGEVNDDELLKEVGRRGIDIHKEITKAR